MPELGLFAEYLKNKQVSRQIFTIDTLRKDALSFVPSRKSVGAPGDENAAL